MQGKDLEAMKASFDAFCKTTEVEKMPNTANEYEDEVDADVEAVKQYFKSEIFAMAKKTIF